MRRIFWCLILLAALAACATPLGKINGDAPTVSVPLKITPDNAKVFLDGVYVGRAAAFTAEKGGLPLTAGGHRLRLEADHYQAELVEVISQPDMATLEIRLLPRPEAPPKQQ